jgi:hypothetical protein
MMSIAHVSTSVDSSDAAVKSAPGLVFWLLVSAGSTGGAYQLNDSTADGGTDMLSGVAPADSHIFMDFSAAPIKFETGIFADIPGTNITLTTGYI